MESWNAVFFKSFSSLVVMSGAREEERRQLSLIWTRALILDHVLEARTVKWSKHLSPFYTHRERPLIWPGILHVVLSVSEMFLLLYPFNHNTPFFPNILTHRKTTTSNGLIRKKKKNKKTKNPGNPSLVRKCFHPLKLCLQYLICHAKSLNQSSDSQRL